MSTATRAFLVLSLLLATSTTAGCLGNPFGGDDLPEVDTNQLEAVPFGASNDAGANPRPVSHDPGTASTAPNTPTDQGDCTRCIQLKKPGTLEPIEPEPDRSDSFEIPYPNIGDKAIVDTDSDLLTLQALHGLDVTPSSATHELRLRNETLPLAPGTPGSPDYEKRHEDGDPVTATFVLTRPQDHAGDPAYTNLTYMDTETRRILEHRNTASYPFRSNSATAVDTMIDPAMRPPMATYERERPAAAVPFHLGAHLWGRTLEPGVTIRVDEAPPGERGTTLTHTYLVQSIHPDHGTASIRLRIHDDASALGTYEIVMHEDSPYPRLITKTGETDPWTPTATWARHLHEPGDAIATTLEQRGLTPLSWGAGAHPQGAPDHGRYLWSGREHIAALNLQDIPYRLDEAIADIDEMCTLADPTRNGPCHENRFLVAADLTTTYERTGTLVRGTLAWHITWRIAGPEATDSWRTTRTFLGDAFDLQRHWITTGHDAQEVTPHPLPARILERNVHQLPHGRLVLDDGGTLSRAVDEVGGNHHPTNRAHLRYDILPDGRATLHLGIGHTPDPYPRPGSSFARDVHVYVELDALTGHISRAEVTYLQ